MRSGSLLVTGFLLLASWTARAGDVVVIANPSVTADSISLADLRSVFLLERSALKDGSFVAPVLQKSGTAHLAFLRRYLDRDQEEMRIYYQGLVFTGKGSMPKELNSDAEVIAYVAKTRGAIGYVSSLSSTEGVKVLEVISEQHRGARQLLTRVEPIYPETLRQMKIGGIVRLSVTVSPKGAVEDVSVLGGNPILGEAAAKAVKQWIYAPAFSRATIEVTINFDPHR